MISTIFLAFVGALMGIALSNVKRATHHEKLVSELNIAEAGINYYLWHLSHNKEDYCDGATCPQNPPYGPYHHDYTNASGEIIGSFDLTITPPDQGDSTVEIKSVGKMLNSKSERTIIAEIGVPSFAKYAFLSNTESWFGDNESTAGPVHSNVGIHFDGIANGLVTASSKKYTPTSTFGGDGSEYDGVWGEGGPKGYWVFPVPAVDFNKISADLAAIKTEANTGGVFLDNSKSSGYHIILKEDGSFDLYLVSKERSSGITTEFVRNYPKPAKGVVYVNDNVWVSGTYSGKITIAAEKSSGQSAKIKIHDNLLYKAKDGSAAIGLVSQGNIEVPSYATGTLEIDAALLSATGHVWFPYADNAVKDTITVYGAIATFDYWTWTWVSGTTTLAGYAHTNQTYDPFLTLSPPPQFPTTGTYAILNWKEE